MKKVLIAGSSGMIGGLILKHCLDSDQISEVILIIRKNSGLNHPKLRKIIHRDFTDFSPIVSVFQNIDTAFFCVGVYTGSVPDVEFKKITVDYAKAFADALKSQSPGATLCFLSGQGADKTEKSRISFARYKGMAENYLEKKSFSRLYIFRPSYIYPVEKRKEPNISYSIMRSLYPLIKLFGRNASIKSTELAEAMFHAGMNGFNQTIIENIEIFRLLPGKS